ncbi:MAG TPA: FAD-dependent monooxygenase [Chthonomonadaceae bacterium]|nr:FAD-dependent monooxygenase [Chthonomonadaceae bacterium]
MAEQTRTQAAATSLQTTGDQNAPVVIAGAGPVGLSLALGLARRGVRSIVLEKKPALSEHSKALGILARTLEIFRAWGILDRFQEKGALLSRISVWLTQRPMPVATVDLGVLSDVTAIPGVLILPQDRTERLLLDAVRETGLAEVRFSHEVTAFRQDEAGVDVTISPAGADTYTLRCTYLIGCDGPHSTVRQQFGWNLEGQTYPTRMLLADVRLTDERDSLPWPRLAPQRRGALAAVRFDAQEWRIISTLRPEETDEEALTEESLRRRVERLFGPGPYERVWSSTFRIHCRTSPHFRSRRVLLAGDAAHINSPAGGQGMNSGIQDAHNLAWKLANALRGGDAEVLLESYEQERRSVVIGSIDRYTDLLTRYVLLGPPVVRTPLLWLMQKAIRSPFFVKRLGIRAMMLDVRYTRSAILAGGGPLVGQRAPDGEVVDAGGKRLRLLDLAKREAVLVIFSDGQTPEQIDAVEKALADIAGLRVICLVPDAAAMREGALHDAGGGLRRRWGVKAETAALLRPDGHVGWIGTISSAEAVRAGVERALGLTRHDSEHA